MCVCVCVCVLLSLWWLGRVLVFNCGISLVSLFLIPICMAPLLYYVSVFICMLSLAIKTHTSFGITLMRHKNTQMQMS